MWLLNTPDILESLYVVFGFKVNNFVNMIFFLQLGVNNEFFQYIYIYIYILKILNKQFKKKLDINSKKYIYIFSTCISHQILFKTKIKKHFAKQL
jgi:hypothetical protein